MSDYENKELEQQQEPQEEQAQPAATENQPLEAQPAQEPADSHDSKPTPQLPLEPDLPPDHARTPPCP